MLSRWEIKDVVCFIVATICLALQGSTATATNQMHPDGISRQTGRDPGRAKPYASKLTRRNPHALLPRQSSAVE